MRKGESFERDVLLLIQKMGFEAKSTKTSRDGGIDIIATNSNPLLKGKYIIQCKDWCNPIGEPPLRDLFGVVHSERANKGILITTSTFTTSAKLFAQDKPIELIDGEQYLSLLFENGAEDEGVNPHTNPEESEELEFVKNIENGLIRLTMYYVNKSSIGDYQENNYFGSVHISGNDFEFKCENLPGKSIKHKNINFPKNLLPPLQQNYLFWALDNDEMASFNQNLWELVIGCIDNSSNRYAFILDGKKDVVDDIYQRIIAFSVNSPAFFNSQNSTNSANVGTNPKQCFVATTVYGNVDCIEVIKLRRWRDKVLQRSYFGIKLIKLYYKYGERLARYVNKHPLLKRLTKLFLDRFTLLI